MKLNWNKLEQKVGKKWEKIWKYLNLFFKIKKIWKFFEKNVRTGLVNRVDMSKKSLGMVAGEDGGN